MEIEIIDQPLGLRLYGLSAAVDNQCYGEVGLRLMDALWGAVRSAQIKTTGINHWVYLPEDRMFVGVEVPDPVPAAMPAPLTPFHVKLSRHARHVHIGPYGDLPQAWRTLKAELSARCETVTLPSLEVYGHCSGDDDSQAETTILLGLEPREM